MIIKSVPENDPRMVNVVEGGISFGLLLLWIGLVMYHIHAHKEPEPFSPGDSLPKRAILLTYPEITPLPLSMLIGGVTLFGCGCFYALFWLESRQKSKWMGIFTGFIVSVSAWHLFRIEGDNAISNLLDADPTNDDIPVRDLWAPLLSNMVLMILSIIMVQRNLIRLKVFRRIDPDQIYWVKLLILVGVLIGQVYFSAMIYIHFWFGFTLLCMCPFITCMGVVLGAYWESQILDEEIDVLVATSDVH